MTSEKQSHKALQSYLEWWRLAGVEQQFSEEAVAWGSSQTEPHNMHASGPANTAQTDTQKTEALKIAGTPAVDPAQKAEISQSGQAPIFAPSSELSHNIEGYLEFLQSQHAPRPRCGLGSVIAPKLLKSPELAVIVDMPDPDDQKVIMTGQSGALLANILRALDLAAEKVAILSLLPQYCADPDLESADLQGWAGMIHHQLSIIAPAKVILLGKLVNSALTQHDLGENRRNLQFINHDNANLHAVASFHPRTLIAKPAMKVAAWRDWLKLKGL